MKDYAPPACNLLSYNREWHFECALAIDFKVKISLVTPSLDAAHVLRDCIESVRAQTVACEHILIDGGSTDGTLDLVAGYDSHFAHVVSEPDKGLYAAMNKGIGLATGDIVGILNADDVFASEKVLEAVGSTFHDLAIDACYGDLEYVTAANRVTRHWRSGEFDRQKFYNGWMPPHPTLFVRRSVYEKYGLFREDIGTSADYELILRMFVKHTISACYLPQVLVHMRTGGASNRSLLARWQANRNDRLAWQVNGLRPRFWTIAAKPLRKLGQWWV